METDAPIRIQLRRTKGWRKPENTIVVARPSKWGNPFPVTYYRDAESAVEAFKSNAETMRDRAMRELRGKNLACWCPLDQPCHADVLLELANRGEA